MKNPWKRTASRIAYQNPWIKVREDQVIHPDGKPGIYAVVEVKPSVFIVAVNDANEIYFIEQYRYTNDRMSIEIPAGSSDGEDPLLAAKRELQEETGLVADNWQKIGELDVHNGICQEVMYVFLATSVKQTNDHHQEMDGIKRTLLMSVDEAKAASLNGKIRDSETIAALTLAWPHLDNN